MFRWVSSAAIVSSCLRPRVELRAAIRCQMLPTAEGYGHHRFSIALGDSLHDYSLACVGDRSDECDRHVKPWEREHLHDVYNRRAEQHHGVRHPRGSRRHDHHPLRFLCQPEGTGGTGRRLAGGAPGGHLEQPAGSEAGEGIQECQGGRWPHLGAHSEPGRDGENARPRVAHRRPRVRRRRERRLRTVPSKKAPKAANGAKQVKTVSGAREGSKTVTVVALLERKGGATLAEIMKATG